MGRAKRMFRFMLAAVMCVSLCACSKAGKGGGEENSSPAFIKGADISSLEAVEDYGGKFYDFDGKETDVVEFLMENGCNYFRLRVWNNPAKSFDAGDYCSPEHTVEMAKRIKKAGGNYLLDFHYSDWWADPDNQAIPAQWQGMSAEELVQAVYDFTKEVLTMLKEADAYPDMVQIGNEIGNGMLWGHGSIDKPETLAALLNSGIKAVRDTTPEGKETKVMIHVQDGGYVGVTEKFFSTLEANGVTDYDVVGLSYYPYWHGTFADLKDNINNIYKKFGKQVVVAETAYPFTYENADSVNNMVMETETTTVGFEATPENQRKVFELVMNAVSSCEGGLGVFYWEPAWIAVEGAGVAKGSGNEWENQTLFDFTGKALEAVKAFGFEPGTVAGDTVLHVYPFDNVQIDKNAAGKEVLKDLPETAEVLYSDGSIKAETVAWAVSSRKDIGTDKATFTGTVAGTEISVEATLIDKYGLNNLGFEDGLSGWIVEGDTEAGFVALGDAGCPHDGNYSFAFWDSDNFTLDVYHYVKITETNQYNLEMWSEGKGGTRLLVTLYIADETGKYLDSESLQNTGWADWKNPCVTAALNEGDIIRIGAKIQGVYDDWGAIDDFSFYAAGQKPVEDTSDDTQSSDVPQVEGNNLLVNPSFERGEEGWTVTRENTEAGTARNDGESTPYTGTYSFHYWNATDFTIDVQQSVIIAEDGSYTVAAHSQGDAETGTVMTLYVKDESGTVLASADCSNAGWAVWQTPVLENISLTAGQTVTVGVTIHGKANGWGTLDDISFMKGE